MTHSSGQFPNETYLNGLRDDPASSIAVLYSEFRPAMLREFASTGENESDAAFFFQMAVNDAVRLARTDDIPHEVPFPVFLEALATAHADIYSRRTTFSPRGFSERDANRHQLDLPSPEALRQTQDKALAWACLHNLEPECQETLLTDPEPTDMATSEKRTACTTELLQSLQHEGVLVFDQLPDWAVEALQDQDGFAIWQRTQALEQGWSAEKPVAAPEPSSQIWRLAVAAFLVVMVGYSAYQFYYRPKTAAEVFADNFAPPGSLRADMETRYDAEMGNDSVTARPSECMLLLREADMHYQSSNYEAAMDPLLLIVLDSASICQSDAWYFLGIVQLQLEDPATAIQCFAKIDDLERYGEDLYWYQALAFVQMAKGNPLLRDRAKHAIERTRDNTRDPERRAQAEAMLESLSK